MSHLELFQTLDKLLFATKQYWQCTAFEHRDIPWPELASKLINLNDEQVAALEANPNELNAFLADSIPALQDATVLTHIARLSTPTLEFPFWLTNGVKGRKVAQLQGFVAGVNEHALPILEWCAGKGHLGRMLIHHGAPKSVSVELQTKLVEQGNQLAIKHKMPICSHQVDVMSDSSSQYVEAKQHAVALHACGGLHQRLMRLAVENKTQKLTLSPCCYHLFQESDSYQAMSQVASASNLDLTARDLKLALQETVTAGQRISKLRHIETHWRLSLDCLLDDVMDKSYYFPVPSINKAMFSGSFTEFCQWAADVKGFKLPAIIDEAKYLALGAKRKQVSQRVELVRHGFRRMLELWLVLDRCLYLEQSGYAVTLREFCDKSITPRNFIIQCHLN